jgi:hypothetical protein
MDFADNASQARIVGVQVAWMRSFKLAREQQYILIHWIPAIPAGKTSTVFFVDLAVSAT